MDRNIELAIMFGCSGFGWLIASLLLSIVENDFTFAKVGLVILAMTLLVGLVYYLGTRTENKKI